MKDRRLIKGLRSVALSLHPYVAEKADSFTLLQSIAAHCGVKLGEDGSVATCKEKPDNCSYVVRLYACCLT